MDILTYIATGFKEIARQLPGHFLMMIAFPLLLGQGSGFMLAWALIRIEPHQARMNERP